MVKIRFNRSTDTKRWGLRLFLEHQIVVNWTILKKSILLLILAAVMNLFWISWDIFILTHPAYSAWVHLNLVWSQLWTSLIMLVVLVAIIFPCHFYRDRKWAKEFLPLITVQVFTAMLCHNSYLVGSFSPATMVGYVSVVGVGLILFNRKMIYYALVPATIALLFCNYMSIIGALTYAPLFKMAEINKVAMHPFWVGSMMFLLVPIMLACLFLFEVLLTQWRTRETAIQLLSRLAISHLNFITEGISSHLGEMAGNFSYYAGWSSIQLRYIPRLYLSIFPDF